MPRGPSQKRVQDYCDLGPPERSQQNREDSHPLPRRIFGGLSASSRDGDHDAGSRARGSCHEAGSRQTVDHAAGIAGVGTDGLCEGTNGAASWARAVGAPPAASATPFARQGRLRGWALARAATQALTVVGEKALSESSTRSARGSARGRLADCDGEAKVAVVERGGARLELGHSSLCESYRMKLRDRHPACACARLWVHDVVAARV